MASKDDSAALQRRRNRQDALKSYYSLADDPASPQMMSEQRATAGTADSCDINGPSFEPDVYLGRLIKERSLTELMDKEAEMVQNIRSLDSDMQTLVYENYNKFISATDTIRTMKNDFKKMEDEMDHLATNMAAITEFSARISDTLQDRRQQITQLSGVHTLLKKLQFLFELPVRLQKCLDTEAYSQAVRCYCKASKVLDQYQHMPSFHGIQQDCQLIVEQLRTRLKQQFHIRHSSAKQLAECVDLLLQLNEPAEQLCDEFLAHARQKIDTDLQRLDVQIRLLDSSNNKPVSLLPSLQDNRPASSLSPSEDDTSTEESACPTAPMDVLEFVDCGCNGFLSNVCLVIASYNDMFLNRQQDNDQLDAVAQKKLVNFVHDLMTQYFDYVCHRVQLERGSGDNTILVRALDRFHRRLQAMNKLLPDTDFSKAGTEIVSRAARDRVHHYLNSLKQYFADCLTDIRQSLAVPRLISHSDTAVIGNTTSSSSGASGTGSGLGDLLREMHTSLVSQVKSVLSQLQAFVGPDITFAMKPYFRGAFCREDVREGLVVSFIRHILTVSQEFCVESGDKVVIPSSLILILSRLCYDLDQSTIGYLLTLVDEQFLLEDKSCMTSSSELCSESHTAAQRLLSHYVRMQGLAVSQMLRKSIETRDCLSAVEPRTVRAAMKRVVEDVAAMDVVIGQLYEEGTRTERTSDSTRRSYSFAIGRQGTAAGPARSTWSITPSTVDTSLLSNIQKLFSEKIEIFSPVDFTKVSVLTGVIKISLKTFLECVRLRTFGRYGLQQIQVDTHYLQLYLWRFVADENLVHMLLDEIVASTVHRCLDAVTMEPSVVELICERG